MFVLVKYYVIEDVATHQHHHLAKVHASNVSIRLFSYSPSHAHLQLGYRYLIIRFRKMANISHQAWEAQPPYQQPDSPSQQARQFDKEMQGACHCGRIKFWLSKDKPLASKYCHCDDCKTIHGGFIPLFMSSIYLPWKPSIRPKHFM